MKNNNGNEKRSARSNDNSRRTSVGRGATDENSAMRTTATSPSPSTEQHIVPLLERGSQQGQGVARRCYPIPTEVLPGAEAVRGPEYNEEDEEGTVIIGERSEIVESDEIIAARVVDMETEEDLRSQVESLRGQLRRNETIGGIGVQTLYQPPNSLLPESPPLYGRKDELTRLGEVLGMGGRMAALVGGAGMGKTHCASHFARQWLREDVAHRFVLWLESDTENVVRVSYLKALDTVLGEVPATAEEMSIHDLAQLVWQKLREQSTRFEWMVVYNNVPEVLDDSEGPEAFSPLFFRTPFEDWGRGRILLTTRCTSYGGRIKSLGNHHVTKIQIDPLDESTAVGTLIDSLEDTSASDCDLDDAKEVVKLLGYMPLAIVSANSQMVDASLTVSEYLDDLNDGLAESDIHDAVSFALANALAYARTHGLGDVLEVAAFLSPDQLTLELLGCTRKMARRLCRLSLLHHAGDDVYTMHRLHQEVARDGILPLKAITSVNQALKRFDTYDSDTWKLGISMMPHLDSLEDSVETMKTHGSLGSLDKAEYAQLLAVRAQIMHYTLHMYEGARTQYEKSIVMWHQHDPDAQNIDLAKTLSCLGDLERKLGNYPKARLHYESAFEMKRSVYGPNAENADLAETLLGQGHLEMRLGNYKEARSQFEQSLEMNRQVYGADTKNTDLASTLSYLGDLERKLGNFGDSRLYFEQALNMNRHMYGPDAKNTELAKTLGNLGILEMKLGNYEEARLHLKESFDMKRHVYGPDAKNADLAYPLGSLGDLKMKLGEYEEARSHYEQAFGMKRHVYGPEAKNTDLAFTLNNLGRLEMRLGNHEEARSHFEQALEMQRHVYGPDAKNADLAFTFERLGRLESHLGDYEQARLHFRKSLEMKQHLYGPKAKNTDLATILRNLGNLERELEDFNESRLHLEESLSMLRHVHGPEARHANLAATLDSLGSLEKPLGNYDAAREKYSEALDMAINSIGENASTNHPLVEEIRGNLADLG